MDENIKDALNGLNNSLAQLQWALEKKFNEDEETIRELRCKVVFLEDINHKHRNILNTIANSITEGMKE